MSDKNQELTVSKEWDQVKTKFPLIEAGHYDVVVDEIEHHDNERVDVQFVILDEGRFQGRRLFRNYVMSTAPGLRLLKELTEAIGVEPDGVKLDLAPCKRRVLKVRVKNRDYDGKTYANVVEHIATRENTLSE